MSTQNRAQRIFSISKAFQEVNDILDGLDKQERSRFICEAILQYHKSKSDPNWLVNQLQPMLQPMVAMQNMMQQNMVQPYPMNPNMVQPMNPNMNTNMNYYMNPSTLGGDEAVGTTVDPLPVSNPSTQGETPPVQTPSSNKHNEGQTGVSQPQQAQEGSNTNNGDDLDGLPIAAENTSVPQNLLGQQQGNNSNNTNNNTGNSNNTNSGNNSGNNGDADDEERQFLKKRRGRMAVQFMQ